MLKKTQPLMKKDSFKKVSRGNQSVMRVKATLFCVSGAKKEEGALIRGGALNRKNTVYHD